MNIPQENGEAFIDPPLQQWSRLLALNEQSFDSYRFSVDGVPFPYLRLQARRELLPLGLKEQNPWLFTGHQPIFMHPGIWMRFLLCEKVREFGWSGVAFIVDSDVADSLVITTPYWDQGFSRKEIRLLLEGGPLFEKIHAPKEEAWRSFIEEVEANLNFPEAEEARNNFARIHQFRSNASFFPLFSSDLRRFWEGSPSYPELTLSRIVQTEAFNHFFLHITQHARAFAESHNRMLAEWRAVNKPRSAAIPFPDLKETINEVELPFWWVGEGRRDPLFLSRAEILRIPEKELGPCESLLSGGNFRPRAATLTMFIRLFLADLFIHGMGGAKYEEVTDQIIRLFFKVEPPQFSTATLTLFFPGLAQTRAKELRQLLRKMENEPEAYLSAKELRDNEWLIMRKRELLKEGKLSKMEYKELSSINLALREKQSQDLLKLKRRAQQEEEKEKALAYRQFPFFFFDSLKVWKILDRL